MYSGVLYKSNEEVVQLVPDCVSLKPGILSYFRQDYYDADKLQ